MESSAEFSPCRRYRYALTRRWADGPQALFIMLNPSTADEAQDDATIGRCISFAKAWGYGALTVGNLFAYCTPSPTAMITATDPVGPSNDQWLSKLQERTDLTIAAWGNNGRFMDRGKTVAQTLTAPQVLRLNQTGEPRHPLYVAANTQPSRWELGTRKS